MIRYRLLGTSPEPAMRPLAAAVAKRLAEDVRAATQKGEPRPLDPKGPREEVAPELGWGPPTEL